MNKKQIYDVVGFGACGVDITMLFLLCQKNEKILAQETHISAGGVTANNLAQCAKLGLKTAWLGVLGDDYWYEYLMQEFRKDNIAVPQIIKKKTTNTQFVILSDPHGNNTMIGSPLNQKLITAKLVTDKFTSVIRQAKHLHLEVAITNIAATYRAAQIAKKHQVNIILDIDMNPFADAKTKNYIVKLLKLADVVKTSEHFRSWAQLKNNTLALKWLYNHGPNLIFLTRANKGALAFDGQKMYNTKGLTIAVKDTAGAGDAFMGGLSYGLLQSWPIQKTLDFANACGAYKCTQMSTRASGTLKILKHSTKNTMEIIKTKSFEIATFSRGDKDAPKLALLLPGRLDTKDYCNFVSHADYLAGKGFFVVAIDPPGTWDSPGSLDLYTTSNYIQAVDELINYFGNKPTLLLGHSRGGAVSVFTALKNSHVQAIVPVMANYGTPTTPTEEAIAQGFQMSYRDLPPGDVRTEEKKEFALPIAYWEDGKKYHASEAIQECTVPKLIIYGDDDAFTSMAEVETLYEAMPEPKMKKLVESAHDYRHYPEAIRKTEEVLGEFLGKYFVD